LIFISLGRFRRKPTKELSSQVSKMLKYAKKKRIKILGFIGLSADTIPC